jgi:hypothetical protein
MPASEIMQDFSRGTLHSGRGGPIVKKKKQAKAIELSYLRKEGHDIPEKRGLAHSYRREKHGRAA